MANQILLTGGTGFIGSHTAVELMSQGYEVIIVDDLSNSELKTLKSIERITGKKPKFYQADIRQYELINAIFKKIKSQASFILLLKKLLANRLNNLSCIMTSTSTL